MLVQFSGATCWVIRGIAGGLLMWLLLHWLRAIVSQFQSVLAPALAGWLGIPLGVTELLVLLGGSLALALVHLWQLERAPAHRGPIDEWSRRRRGILVGLLTGMLTTATILLFGDLARREIAKVVAGKNGRWYGLDLGNEQHSGQVLLGNVTDVATIRFDRLGLCSGLPSPYVQAPALLEPPPAAASPLSCADLALREAQSLVVNQQVAVLAAHYAYRFLVCRELTQMATTFSLEPAVSKSYLLTKQRMAACGAGR